MKTFNISKKLPKSERQEFAWTIKYLQAKFISYGMALKKEGRDTNIGVEI